MKLQISALLKHTFDQFCKKIKRSPFNHELAQKLQTFRLSLILR